METNSSVSLEPGFALLTRRYRFCCSHRLHNPRLSDRRNHELYQECNNHFGHGHDYILEATFQGEIDPLTGMCVNLGVLDRIVRDEVIEPYDHKNLNYDSPDFESLIPTAENILKIIWERLSQRVPEGVIHKLKLIETTNNYFEYYG